MHFLLSELRGGIKQKGLLTSIELGLIFIKGRKKVEKCCIVSFLWRTKRRLIALSDVRKERRKEKQPRAESAFQQSQLESSQPQDDEEERKTFFSLYNTHNFFH